MRTDGLSGNRAHEFETDDRVPRAAQHAGGRRFPSARRGDSSEKWPRRFSSIRVEQFVLVEEIVEVVRNEAVPLFIPMSIVVAAE